jgi:hypothetical protein
MFSTSVLLLALAANPHLDEGRKLYEQLKYPEAEARLKIAAEAPNNTSAEQAQIADLLARAMIAQGRSAEAERVYSELLAKQSDAPDPAAASPKIREVFNRAKRSVYPEGFVRVQRAPSAAGRLEVELIDPWRKVKSLSLAVSKAGAAWVAQPMTTTARHAGADLAPPPGATWRCTVEALDDTGTVVASLATRDAPLVFEALPAKVTTAAPEVPRVEAPKGPTRWPAFVVGALALAAIGTGTGFAISSSHDYGQVMPMTPALMTRSLDDSARSKALVAWLTFGGALLAATLCGVLIWNW